MSGTIRKYATTRLAAVLASLVLLASPVIAGAHGLVTALVEKRVFDGPPPEYTEQPGPVYRGENPGRDPMRGWWTQASLADRDAARKEWFGPDGGGWNGGNGSNEGLWASVDDLARAYTIYTAPGPGFEPGEGQYGGVNTHTGNRLSTYPIVHFDSRGDSNVDLTLYHNSQNDDLESFGYSWTHSYSGHILYTTGASTATVVMPDGLEAPFTLSGGTWHRPAGFFAGLVQVVGGGWTLTMKDGTVDRFDSAGKLTSVEDRFGNATTVAYSGSLLTTVTSADGRALTFGYTTGRITSVTDPMGRVWGFSYTSDRLMSIGYPHPGGGSTPTRSFTYDTDYDILTETDLNGKVWTSTYGFSDELVSATDPTSRATTYTYNSTNTVIALPHDTGTTRTVTDNYSSGLLASSVDEASFSDANVYDSDRNVTQYTDKRGKVWHQTFDTYGNTLTVTNPLGKVWTYTYTSLGDVATATDPLSHTTTYAWTSGELTSVQDPVGAAAATPYYKARYTYDGYGDLLTVKDGEGRTTTYTYDSQGDANSVTDPAGVDRTAHYDLDGRIDWVKDHALNQISVSYDPQGRINQITNPGGSTKIFGYDGEGRTLSATDEIGRTVYRSYDDAGRVTEDKDGNGDPQDYVYGGAGFVLTTTDGNYDGNPAHGHVRTYVPTLRGESYSLTYADGSVEYWSRNGNGDTTQYEDGLARITGYTYDNAGRATLVDRPVATDVAVSYDDADRKTGMTDGTGTTSWTYDAANRLTQLVQPNGKQTYGYNQADQQTSMTEYTPGGTSLGTTTYTYGTTTGRLDSLANRFSQTTSYAYDSLGRLSTRTLANGVWEAYGYDARSRTTSITVEKAGPTVLRTHTYGYDNASQITSDQIDSTTTTYGYDGAGQLTAESRTGYSASYNYDHNYNRTSRTVGGVTHAYAYDSADKLQTVKIGATTIRSYSYDADGQPTGVTDSAGTSVLAWDDDARLTSLTPPGSSAQTHSYNGFGAQIASGGLTFVRNGAGVLGSVLRDGAADYTPGISEKRGGTSSYRSGDLKSFDVQTNSTAGVSGKHTYDGFGRIDTSTGTWNGPFGFGGQYDYETDGSGLQLLGNRWYDPEVGRFLTRDPIKDGRNWYAYCKNDPVSFEDSDGLKLTIVGPDTPGDGPKFTGDQVKKVRKAIDDMRKTKRGREILKEIEGDDETFRIRPGVGGEEPQYDPKTKEVILRPDQEITVETTDGWRPFVLPALIGHELGHAVGGLDEGISQMDNIIANENPIRKGLGLPARISYEWRIRPL